MQEYSIDFVKELLIVGSGTMGWRIGLQGAISGFEVTLYDLNDTVLESAVGFQDKTLHRLVKAGIVPMEEVEAIKSRISLTTDIEVAASSADVVSESVTEDRDLKVKVWEQLGPLLPEHTVMTTNTSYMLASWFAEASGAPERFAAFHFHDVFKARVVDIMPHPGTAPWINGLLYDLGLRLNQIPVYLKREANGYVFNHMLASLINSAMTLKVKEVASIEDIDRSFMGNFSLKIGPFGMLDDIGLDTVWHVTKNTGNPALEPLLELLDTYISAGKLGIKTGEGFYSYPAPAYLQPDFLMGQRPDLTI